MDLAATEMRPLIDLRSQPNYQRASQLSSQPVPTVQMPAGVILEAERPNGDARITPH